MTLSTRLAIAMVVVAALSSAAVGYFVYRNLEPAALANELSRIEANARQAATDLDVFTTGTRADLLALLHSPATQAVVAELAGEADPSTANKLSDVELRAAELFKAQMIAKPALLQIRIIGNRRGGREIVRVERTHDGERPRVVKFQDLQEKSHRPYFQKTIPLPAGSVYISSPNLNRERGKIQVPHVPVLHAATPLYLGGGKPVGILVINLDLRSAFDRIRDASTATRRMYVVNEFGDILVGPNREDAFAFETGDPRRIQTQYPELSSAIANAQPTAVVLRDEAGVRLAAAVIPQVLAEGTQIFVVETVPLRVAFASIDSVRRSSIVAGIFAVLGAVVVSVWLSRSLTKELGTIATAVQRFPHDESVEMPSGLTGEIGALANAFDRMMREVRTKTMSLQFEIEERKKAEREISVNLEEIRRLSEIVASTNDAIIATSTDGSISSWNPAAERLFEYSSSEIVGKSIRCIIPKEKWAEARERQERLFAGEPIEHFETVRVTKTGKHVDVSLSLSVVHDPTGAVVGVAQSARDISRRRQAEQRFQLAVEASPSGILMVDADGDIQLVNTAIEEMFRYKRSELLGRPVELLVPVRSRETHPDLRKGFFENPSTRQMGGGRELFGRRRDGTEFPVEIGLNPADTDRGSFVLAVVNDITQRKQAEERFRLAVEACPGGVVMVDANGEILLINQQLESLFGYERNELIGTSVELLVPERFQKAHPAQRQAFIGSPSARSMGAGRDLFGLRKDGTEFPVEIGLNPVQTPDGIVVLAVVIDITERKAAETKLQDKTRELERSNADLEQFAYVASHDLQEPLRMVVSYTELFEERYRGQLDEKATKYVRYIVEGGKRMQQLVKDLLAYSRVGTRQKPLQPVAIESIIEKVLQGMQPILKSTNAEIDIGPMPTLNVDETQISQVFQNLIGNAIKFRDDESPKVVIRSQKQGTEWMFSVQDNGIGIEMEYANRIFQMFQRLHERGKYEGSGIGLAIVKKVVERHGGRVWFESQFGRGATFYFTIPG